MTNNYYQKHKEKPRQEAHERYQNPSEEEREKKKGKKAWQEYQNLTEEGKEESHN